MFAKNISLKEECRYKIGGRAKYFFAAKTADAIMAAVSRARQLGEPIFVLGGGTNILFADGFPGVVIQPAMRFVKKDGFLLRVGAGASISELLDYSITHSLSGLEWAGGLPGTVGGAVYGNAGCFGGEIKDAVLEVVSIESGGRIPAVVRRTNRECGFGYRSSVFKEKRGREIILEATLLLKKGDRRAIRRAVEERIRYRVERHPLHFPNVGSIFKNVPLTRVCADGTRNYAEGVRKHAARLGDGSRAPVKTDPFPVIPTAHLIAEAGLKGISCGGAMISPKHPNFIVNVLDAKAGDVLALIALVKHAVKEKFGIALEEEVIIV